MPRVEIAQAALDGQVQAALRLRRVDRRQAVGPGDDHEVVVAEVVGDGAHHAQLADHLRRRDQRLAADVAAALGQHLVLDVRRGDARVDVQLGLALDVEDVAVAGVHVDDHRRDVEVPRGDALLGVADRRRQLELAQRADTVRRAPSAISGPL